MCEVKLKVLLFVVQPVVQLLDTKGVSSNWTTEGPNEACLSSKEFFFVSDLLFLSLSLFLISKSKTGIIQIINIANTYFFSYLEVVMGIHELVYIQNVRRGLLGFPLILQFTTFCTEATQSLPFP